MTETVEETAIEIETTVTKTVTERGIENVNVREKESERGIATDAVEVLDGEMTETEGTIEEVTIATTEETGTETEIERKIENVSERGIGRGLEIEIEATETANEIETTEGPVLRDENGHEMREKEIGIVTETLIDIGPNASHVSRPLCQSTSRFPRCPELLHSSNMSIRRLIVQILDRSPNPGG